MPAGTAVRAVPRTEAVAPFPEIAASRSAVDVISSPRAGLFARNRNIDNIVSRCNREVNQNSRPAQGITASWRTMPGKNAGRFYETCKEFTTTRLWTGCCYETAGTSARPSFALLNDFYDAVHAALLVAFYKQELLAAVHLIFPYCRWREPDDLGVLAQ